MTYAPQVRAILDEYAQALEETARQRRPTEGLLGFGRKLGDEPCHEIMDRKIAALTETLLADDGAEDADEAASLLLRAEADGAWPEAAKFALIAAQRHLIPLVSRLSRNGAAEMAAWFEKRYPVFRRLPVQKQLLKALKNAGK